MFITIQLQEPRMKRTNVLIRARLDLKLKAKDPSGATSKGNVPYSHTRLEAMMHGYLNDVMGGKRPLSVTVQLWYYTYGTIAV